MSNIKIKLCSGWDSSINIAQRLISQFNTSHSSIATEFVFDDSYDMIVYNNYITEKAKPHSKSLLFFHEPSWSGNHQKTFDVNDNIIVHGYNKNIYNNCSYFKESISHMFYGGAGSWREGNNFWTYNNLSNTIFNKTQNISCIASSLGSVAQDWIGGSIYKHRFDIINTLSRLMSDQIDFFGGSVGRDLPLKKDGLVNYKFSICIENTNELNYISEKFYDAILTNTIPIYFGCKNIKDIWPQDGYILLESITDIDYVYQQLLYIYNNLNSLYDKMLNSCLDIKYNFLNTNNLYTRLLENI